MDLMELEKGSNINQKSTSSSNKDLQIVFKNNYTQEIVNLMIKSLIKEYSLYKVINSIIFSTSFDNNSDLESFEAFTEIDAIIYQIYLEVGKKPLFNALLALNVNDMTNLSKEKKISMGSTSEDENGNDIINEEDKDNKINKENNIININDDINEENMISINNNKNEENQEVIDIKDNLINKEDDINSENNNNDINNINNNSIEQEDKAIDLSESDDNSSDSVLLFVDLNNIPTEDINKTKDIINIDNDKSDNNIIIDNNDNINKTISEPIIINNIQKKSPKKLIAENINNNDKSMIINKELEKIRRIHMVNNQRNFKVKDISYHCSIIEGIYFKYKILSKINQNLVKFVCINPKCHSWGIYDTNDKTFTLQEGHWADNTIICYHKSMTKQDKKNYLYMLYHDLDELQMYNDQKDKEKNKDKVVYTIYDF